MAPQSLQERVTKLQGDLTALRQSTNRSAGLTLVIGGIVLVVLCGYFYYGYREISSVMTPDNLVAFAFTQLDSEIPNLSARIEKEVKEGAPQWADQLSKQVITAIPDARKQLEEHVLKEADKGLKEVNVMTDEHFRKFMKDNHSELDKMFKDLASNDPKLAEGHLKRLEDMANKEMQRDMQAQMHEFMDTVRKAHQQLRKLKDSKKLSEAEENEKRLLMITRRLQSELDPGAALPGRGTGPSKDAPKKDAPKNDEKK